MHELQSATDLLCGGCGYNLRGTSSDRCPECGRRFSPDHLVNALIPWEQRRYIGRARAYVHTAWIASFRPQRLISKMAWPINRFAARLFHFWTIVLAAITLSVAAWVLGPPRITRSAGPVSVQSQRLEAALLNQWSMGITVAALIVWMTLATLLPGCWYCPRRIPVEQQNRARALSHYACAPLVWVCLMILACCGLTPLSNWWPGLGSADRAVVALYIAAALILIQLAIWIPQRRRREWTRSMRFVPGSIGAVLLLIGMWWTWDGSGLVTREMISILLDALHPVLLVGATILAAYWWLLSVCLMKRATGSDIGRAIWMAIALPTIWLLLLIGVLLTAYAAFFIIAMLLAW